MTEVTLYEWRQAFRKIVERNPNWTVKKLKQEIYKTDKELLLYLDLEKPFDDNTLIKDLR